MRRMILTAAAAAACLSLPAPVSGQQVEVDSIFYVHRSSTPLLRLNVDGGFAVMGQTEGGMPALGAGRRMMWIPSRAAFRAGAVEGYGSTYWDLANVGLHSAAFGNNTRASGPHSFAAGLATTASGDAAVALGNNSTASADRAFAAVGSSASGVAAVAIGSGAQATNDDALALGPSSIAGGLASVAIGPSIANGNFGVAIGLQNSASGQFSVAIGKNARTANRQGSIVISDASAGFSMDSVYPTANNQIVMRGAGGIKMYTSQQLRSGVELFAGGGSWSSISDRNRKENFAELDGEEVLARLREVPVSSWNYLTQEEEVRHVGPMAQDFYQAFGLGESDLLINTIDIDGVNMAGVKALDARTEAQAQRIEALEAEVTDLRARLERLEQLIGDDAR